MGLKTYLQSLSITHGMLLENNVDVFTREGDFGDSPDPTRLRNDQFGTAWGISGQALCGGVTASFRAFGDNTDFTTRVLAGEIDSRNDINATNTGNLGDASDQSSYNWSTGERAMGCWFSQTSELSGGEPTLVMGHGGGTNNHLLHVGLGGQIAFQSADQGQPFLSVASKDTFIVGRNYLAFGLWQHHTDHAGSGNRVLLFVNGVLQSTLELTGTDAMASATGQPFVGNGFSLFQTHGGGTLGYLQREKEINLVMLFNNASFTEATARGIFERTVLPEVEIAADTVENQQAALDLLIGNDYIDTNCAIRILQATDATDYRLFFDGINFPANDNLGDISVQFVGAGDFLVENVNGANATLVNAPAEIYRANEGVVTGGGSISVLEGSCVRLRTLQDVTGVTADKIILEEEGSYVFTDSQIGVVENVSGGIILITSVGNTTIGGVIEETGPVQLIDVTLIVSTPLNFDDNISVFANQFDRDNGVEPLGVGREFRYPRSEFLDDTVWYELSKSNGSTILVAHVLDYDAGTHNVPLIVTSENASIAFIESKISEVSDTLELVAADTTAIRATSGGSASAFVFK